MSVQQGKRVLVVMRNGEHFVAKFKSSTDRLVEFFDHERMRTRDIRTLSIYQAGGNDE